MRKSVTLYDLDLIEESCVRKSRQSLYAYRQYISDFKLKTGWFVKEITEAVEQFYHDYEAGLRPILVIQAPPQHGKSEAVTDGIAWMAGKNPSLRFIYCSFSDRLGVRANLKTQRTIDKPKYKKIFPGTQINSRRTVTSVGYQRNKEMIEFVEAGGSFRNTTVRGSITGETLDIGIIDDPIKGREEANSITIRDKTWSWFTDDFLTRFDEYAGLLIILTRWHIDDPVGRLIESKKKVKLLSYKAIAEQDERYRKEGAPLFPEHKSLEFLMARKQAMPSANWESLYQQNPIIQGGEIFKDAWWRYFNIDALPIVKRKIQTWDTAFKAKESNDFNVCFTIAECSSGYYILDRFKKRMEYPELKRTAKSLGNSVKPHAVLVEDKASGQSLIQDLKSDTLLPVVAIPKESDKVSCANAITALIESGRVFLPEGAEWVPDFLITLAQFPNGTHDDDVDALTQGLKYLSQGGGAMGLLDYAREELNDLQRTTYRE